MAVPLSPLMHAFRFLFPALVAVVLCAAQAVAQSADELSDQYFRAYMMSNEAERMTAAGNLQQAMEKYKQAQQIFDTIAQTAPSWSPDMMKMRRTKLSDGMAALQAKISAAPAPAPAPAPSPPPAPVAAPSTTSITNQFQSAPPVGTTNPVVPAAPANSANPPSLDDAMAIVRNAIQAQTLTLKQQLTETQAQVGRYQMGYETALKQRDQVSSMYQTLSQTATAQQAKMQDLEKQASTNAAAKAELDKLRPDYEDTKAKLADSKDRLAKAESTVMKQTKELMETSMRLTAIQKDRAENDKKLQTISTDRDALAKEVEKLRHDNETISKERDSANATILGMKATGPVPASAKEIAAENERLRQELDTTRKLVDSLKADASNKDKEIAQLKGQLTGIQGELVALKKENAAYESEVSELTVSLKKLRAEMDDPKRANTAESTQLLAESQLLRSIILRQLRQQARQQQQKSAVIAEIKKTENASKELIDQVEQLAGSRLVLSESEQKLFTTPQLQEITGEGGITATIMAKSDAKKPADSNGKVAEKPASGAAALDSLLEKANTFLRDAKFAEAASSYSEVLRADPKNSSGFAGLAMAKMQLNKLDEAEVTLKKSLAYDANNANAHYLLGVTMFRQDRLNEALASFQKSLDISGKNARARHYLGVIASKMGLADRAEREFKATLAIDPNYGEAYFNLAVLYATWDPPKWDEARKNYKEALKQGVKADANLEKILNSQPTSVSKR